MSILLYALGDICSLVGLVCWVVLLIDAFRNDLWQGVIGLICGIYLVYYGLVESNLSWRVQWSLGLLGGSLLSSLFFWLARL